MNVNEHFQRPALSASWFHRFFGCSPCTFDVNSSCSHICGNDQLHGARFQLPERLGSQLRWFLEENSGSPKSSVPIQDSLRLQTTCSKKKTYTGKWERVSSHWKRKFRILVRLRLKMVEQYQHEQNLFIALSSQGFPGTCSRSRWPLSPWMAAQGTPARCRSLWSWSHLWDVSNSVTPSRNAQWKNKTKQYVNDCLIVTRPWNRGAAINEMTAGSP